MGDEREPTELPDADVCRHCREETARYRRGEQHDDRYCFELFRRAIVSRLDGCWEALLEIFSDRVAAWCRNGSYDPRLELDELVGVAWQKFQHAYSPERFAHADGTRSVLTYLKLCAWSVAADAVRELNGDLSLDRENVGTDGGEPWTLGDLVADAAPRPDDEIADADAAEKLWAIITGLLKNETECELMRLTLQLGLKSREIFAQRPDLFKSVDDVYRMTRNVFDRLRRSPELRRWLDGLET